MYRTLFGIAGAVAIALLVVGLTFSTATEERADFVFVNGTEPKTLDPQKMTGQPEGRIADCVYEGLTYNDPATLKPVPGTAASWEVSPDGLRWTFHIRPEARWSNGEPVTAHDFVYAWVRLQEPVIASEYAYLLHMIRHAEAYNTYEGQVEALRAPDGILADLDRLLAADPDGLPATAWQAMASRKQVAAAVVRTPDPVIQGALAREEGRFTPAEGRALRAALEAEAARRAKALAEAKAHFGVDQGVFAPDASTFVVELSAFTPYFLELTAFYPTFPVHRPTVERWPENFFLPGRLVGNGPFALHAWRINHRLRLVKSPTYWGRDAVSLETVDALPIDVRGTALNLYLRGEVDWASAGYPPDLIDRVKERPDFYRNAGLGVYYYRFNCTRKPFDDPRVREAFCLAFDRELLAEKVTRAGQIPAPTYVPPGIPGYAPPESRVRLDPERARRLLAEAGYPEGRGFPRVAILFNTDEGHKKIAEYVAGQWRQHLGVDVNAVNQEWQSYQETTRRLDYQIARAAWIGDYRDPNTFLDMWVTNGGNNQTGWSDPLYDRLIGLAADPLAFAAAPAAERDPLLARLRDRAAMEAAIAAVGTAADPSARVAAGGALRMLLFREAESILFQGAFPVCPVYFYVYTGLVSPRVEGFYSRVSDGAGGLLDNLQDIHPLRDLKMRPPGASGGGGR